MISFLGPLCARVHIFISSLLHHRYSKGNVQKPGKCFSRPTVNVLVHKSEEILNHREICLYVTTNSSLISFNQVLWFRMQASSFLKRLASLYLVLVQDYLKLMMVKIEIDIYVDTWMHRVWLMLALLDLFSLVQCAAVNFWVKKICFTFYCVS